MEERAIVGRRFGDAPEGALVCFVDSWGMVALAVNLGDAAERLGARPGDRLRLEAA
jgi:S-adenosyl-L-methionine hydrolase (adenosine-forming)